MAKKRIISEEALKKEKEKTKVPKKLTDKEKKEFKDILQDSYDFLHESKEEIQKISSTNRQTQKLLIEKFEKQERKVFALIDTLTKKVNHYTAEAKKLRQINEDIEETLTNVLLAIRQNEYLQAWYPSQGGYPEMKVTGNHPIVQKRKST